MVIRCARGRHTFAPTIIRDSIKELKEIFPDFKLKYDSTVKLSTEEDLKYLFSLRSAWLDNLFKIKEV